MATGQGGDKPRSRQFFPWGVGNTTFYLVALFLVTVVGTAFVGAIGRLTIAAAAAIGAFMVGGLFGFIFGIPRYATSTAELERAEGHEGVVKYRGNTNLEQVSDWLTKILIGLGLTQFRSIGRFLNDVAEVLGEALKTGEAASTSSTVAWVLLLVGLIPGFLFFYLWSRVYLPEMFRRAEQPNL